VVRARGGERGGKTAEEEGAEEGREEVGAGIVIAAVAGGAA